MSLNRTAPAFIGTMSLTVADFKKRVAATVNRDATLFTVDSVDNLLAAMNDARRMAQRNHTFALLADDVFLTTSLAGANWMTGCKTTPGGATAVLMKKINGVWNYTTQGALYIRTSWVDFGIIGDYRRTLPLYDTQNLIITNQPASQTRRTFAYINGQNLFVTNTTASTTYMLEGIKFLDDLTAVSDPDVFLTYFTDWLIYATIGALNNYLKDTEKFPIDATIENKLWQSVIQMDGELAQMGQATNLD